MPRKKKPAMTPVGKKIKQFRTQKKMSLENVANETGLSVERLNKIEAGKEIPPVGALLQIARSLQIDSALFLKEQEEDKLTDRVAAYSKRTANYAYTTLTPGAENKHLKAFRVSIDPLTDHEGVGYQHEGEEFVYVLEGSIEVTVGDHVNTLGANDSLHFNSGISHNLKNVGESIAQLLVVIYGP
jgi:transcriptional regulator with XRE-family HTH domain